MLDHYERQARTRTTGSSALKLITALGCKKGGRSNPRKVSSGVSFKSDAQPLQCEVCAFSQDK